MDVRRDCVCGRLFRGELQPNKIQEAVIVAGLSTPFEVAAWSGVVPNKVSPPTSDRPRDRNAAGPALLSLVAIPELVESE